MPHTRTFLTILLLFAARSAGALTINADIIISPNPSPYLSDWQSHRETATLVLSHDGAGPIRLQIRTVLRSLYSGLEIVTAVSTLDNVVSQTSTYTAEKLFPTSSITYDNSVPAELKRLGRVPAGEYELCVYITPISEAPSSGVQTITRCREFVIKDQPVSGTMQDSNSASYRKMMEEQRKRDASKKSGTQIGGTTGAQVSGKTPPMVKKQDDGFSIDHIDMGSALLPNGTVVEFDDPGRYIVIKNDTVFLLRSSYNPKTNAFSYDTIVWVRLPLSLSDDGRQSSQVVRDFYLASIDRPDIDCDSLTKRCKNALTLFWGNVFSYTVGKGRQKSVSGATHEEMEEEFKSTSLSMEKGWVYDCEKKTWEYHFSFQCHDSENGKERSITMMNVIRPASRYCP
jgi:hypothetical protein